MVRMSYITYSFHGFPTIADNPDLHDDVRMAATTVRAAAPACRPHLRSAITMREAERVARRHETSAIDVADAIRQLLEAPSTSTRGENGI